MDIDAALHRARPTPPGPDPAATARHRAQLDRAISPDDRARLTDGAAAGEPDRSPGERHRPEDSEMEPILVRPWPQSASRSTRRRRAVLAAAAVIALVAGVAVAVTDRPTDQATNTQIAATSPDRTNRAEPAITGPATAGSIADRSDEVEPNPSTNIEPSVSPLCGAEFPFDVTYSVSGNPVDGPLPGFEPTRDGQLIRHWTGTESAVELRWPADPRPVEGSGPVSGTMAVAFDISAGAEGIRSIYALSESQAEALLPEGSDTHQDPPNSIPPILQLTPLDAGQTDADIPTGCGQLQVRFVDPDGLRDVLAMAVEEFHGEGVSVESVADWGYLDWGGLSPLSPLIVDRIDADQAPTEVLPCEDGSVSRTDAAIEVAGVHESSRAALAALIELSRMANEEESPAEALAELFPDSPLPTNLFPGGYTEITGADGAITYAHDGYGSAGPTTDGYVVLITVVDTGQGWAVTRLISPGC